MPAQRGIRTSRRGSSARKEQWTVGGNRHYLLTAGPGSAAQFHPGAVVATVANRFRVPGAPSDGQIAAGKAVYCPQPAKLDGQGRRAKCLISMGRQLSTADEGPDRQLCLPISPPGRSGRNARDYRWRLAARCERPNKRASRVARPDGVSGGAGRSRTDLHGFAIRCITALLPRRGADSDKKGKPGLPFVARDPPRKSGAGDESRTRDLNLGKVALYQLSYSRVSLAVYTRNRTARKRARCFVLSAWWPRRRLRRPPLCWPRRASPLLPPAAAAAPPRARPRAHDRSTSPARSRGGSSRSRECPEDP